MVVEAAVPAFHKRRESYSSIEHGQELYRVQKAGLGRVHIEDEEVVSGDCWGRGRKWSVYITFTEMSRRRLFWK